MMKMMKAVSHNKKVMKVKMITIKKERDKDKNKNKDKIKSNHKLPIPMLIIQLMLSAMEWLLELDSSKLLLLPASLIKLMELPVSVMINSLLQAWTETKISVLILRWRENPTISCRVLDHLLLLPSGTQLLLNKITKLFHAAMVSMDPKVPIVKIANVMEPMVFRMDQLVVLAKENNPTLFLTTTETLMPDVLMRLLVI